MSAKFSKRQVLVLGLLLATVAIHVASLCVLVRYYAPSSVFEFGRGFATLYWGGDDEAGRNLCVYNVGEWPLSPGVHFAGDAWPEGQRWEVEGPSFELRPGCFSDAVQYRRGVLAALGYSLPRLRHEPWGKSLLVPVGSLVFLVEAITVFFVVRPDSRKGVKPQIGPSR